MLFLCRGVCSVATQGRAFLPFLHHTPRELVAASFLLRLWPMRVHMDLPAPCMDTSPPLLDGLLVHMVSYGPCLCIWSPPARGRLQAPNSTCLLQMAMTKDAFGGSRVIHGQNCPISAEISQKLDLYSDRPKSGRQASQSSTDGRRPRVFLPQILHVQSVPGFAHRSWW